MGSEHRGCSEACHSCGSAHLRPEGTQLEPSSQTLIDISCNFEYFVCAFIRAVYVWCVMCVSYGVCVVCVVCV